MENDNNPQPLDVLMTQQGVSNADLVKASSEQLSFKLLQKGRQGRRLKPHLQDKILNAFVKVRPGLKLRRRDLFRYDMDESAVEAINEAMGLIREKKISYPQFIDLLEKGGVNRYAVDVAANRVTFYAAAGAAHGVQGPPVSEGLPGTFDPDAIHLAITDAQHERIDHPTFLKRIYDAGIARYEVNVGKRKIVYQGATQAYRENIPLAGAAPESALPAAEEKTKQTPASPKARAKAGKKDPGVKNSAKARKTRRNLKHHRIKKRK